MKIADHVALNTNASLTFGLVRKWDESKTDWLIYLLIVYFSSIAKYQCIFNPNSIKFCLGKNYQV